MVFQIFHLDMSRFGSVGTWYITRDFSQDIVAAMVQRRSMLQIWPCCCMQKNVPKEWEANRRDQIFTKTNVRVLDFVRECIDVF